MRRYAITLAGGALAVTMSGCGFVPGMGQSPLEAVQSAVQQSRGVESYRAEVTTSGALNGQEMNLDAEVVHTESPEPTTRVTMNSGTVTMMRGGEVVTKGNAGMGGPEWVRVDLGDAQGGSQLDPMAQVDQLLATSEPQEVGSVEVNGVSTTEYSGSYHVSESLQEISDPEAREMTEKIYSNAGIEEVVFTVWVGDDGLPRRLVNELGDYTETIDFLEFNQAVDISYPSESEIQDMDEMLNGLGQQTDGLGTGEGMGDPGGGNSEQFEQELDSMMEDLETGF